MQVIIVGGHRRVCRDVARPVWASRPRPRRPILVGLRAGAAT